MNINQVIFLLIIIVVISSAVLIGLITYQHEAYISNQKSMALDMNHFTSQVFVFWKTPLAGGGAGQTTESCTDQRLASFMGFTHVIIADTRKEYYSIITENGEFRIKDINGNLVTLIGIGKYPHRGQLPLLQSTVNLFTYMVNQNMSSAKGL